MSETPKKRKKSSSGAGPAPKKSKGSTAGKWKTPQQKAKMAGKIETGSSLDIGDEGIWVTYARGMNTRAYREFKQLCDETTGNSFDAVLKRGDVQYGESMYSIPKPTDVHDVEDGEGDEGLDIEESIDKELAAIKASNEQPKKRGVFTLVTTGIECVFFMKTKRPVEPDALIRRICQDAKDCPDPRERRCRYINRMTPVFNTDKATENGIERVARQVLAPFFDLVPVAEDGATSEDKATEAITKDTDSSGKPATYAIRHNIRNHTAFKSDAMIKKIANLVDTKHKVNLTSPDKVILVEIFQMFCGISVVDGPQWEELKRYNVNSLYGMIPQQRSGAKQAASDAVLDEEKK